MSDEAFYILSIVVLTALSGLTFLALMLGMYRTFLKAGERGIAAFVPIWNFVVLCKIAGAPSSWAVLFFIPIVNLIFVFAIMDGIAWNFKKSEAFGIGLVLLPPVFFYLLGFGDSEYRSDKKKYFGNAVNSDSSGRPRDKNRDGDSLGAPHGMPNIRRSLSLKLLFASVIVVTTLSLLDEKVFKVHTIAYSMLFASPLIAVVLSFITRDWLVAPLCCFCCIMASFLSVCLTAGLPLEREAFGVTVLALVASIPSFIIAVALVLNQNRRARHIG